MRGVDFGKITYNLADFKRQTGDADHRNNTCGGDRPTNGQALYITVHGHTHPAASKVIPVMSVQQNFQANPGPGNDDQ